jgi:hypothetical protein
MEGEILTKVYWKYFYKGHNMSPLQEWYDEKKRKEI